MNWPRSWQATARVRGWRLLSSSFNSTRNIWKSLSSNRHTFSRQNCSCSDSRRTSLDSRVRDIHTHKANNSGLERIFDIVLPSNVSWARVKKPSPPVQGLELSPHFKNQSAKEHWALYVDAICEERAIVKSTQERARRAGSQHGRPHLESTCF